MSTISPSLTHRPEAFDAVAHEYDARFTNSLIGTAQRESVWQEMDGLFRPGQRVLDINCGTGVDALHFAERGIHVLACDASPAMVAVAQRRLDASPYRNQVEFKVLANESIRQIEDDGLYDGLLSNFSGLNCTADLPCVAGEVARLVRPSGKVVLCVFGRFCLWEMLWYILHADIQKAFRRLWGKGVRAKLADGPAVFVRYPSVRSIRKDFASHFRFVSRKGVGVAVPPSYLEPLAARFDRLFRFAAKIDPFLGRVPGIRSLADHQVLVFERIKA